MTVSLHPPTAALTEFRTDPRHPFVPEAFQRLRHERAATRRPISRQPRVLHIIGSLGNGGAERQLVNTAVGLAKRGVDVAVLTLEPLVGTNAFHLPTLQNHDIPAVALDPVPDFASLSSVPAINALRAEMPGWLDQWPFRIANALIRFSPDIVHAWLDFANIPAAIAALMLGAPRLILSTRSLNPTHFRNLYIRWFQPWYQFLATLDEIIFLNNSVAGQHSYAEWLEVPPARIGVIRNGIDTARFSTAAPEQIAAFRTQLRLSPSDKLITGVFRLCTEKQPLLFIDVAEAVLAEEPDAHMLIVGGGAMESELQARVAASAHAARMHLLPPRTDLPVIYAASHVLLQTSIVEGTPNTLLEAQAAGCPVVTTPAGGAPETLSNGETGFVADTPAALADAVRQLVRNASLRNAMAAAAPSFVARYFGMERAVDETLSLYRP